MNRRNMKAIRPAVRADWDKASSADQGRPTALPSCGKNRARTYPIRSTMMVARVIFTAAVSFPVAEGSEQTA
jgi:hypothetical protein